MPDDVTAVFPGGRIITATKWTRLGAVGAFIGVALLLTILASGRHFLTYATETDFVGNFLPEAMRVWNGVPLQLDFHPPLYPFLLAATRFVVGDWVVAALAISVLSGVAAAICSFVLFSRLLGEWAGWGAVVGLLTSATFLSFSAFATSDAFFCALYLGAVTTAIMALSSTRLWTWAVCGTLVGCALLTRSNALTLLLLLLLPWLAVDRRFRKVGSALALIGGLSIPLAAWAAYAVLTDSPIAPAGNHINLALTYFAPGPDRISGEGRIFVSAKFDNLWETLTYDPVLILKTYIRDLYALPEKLLSDSGSLAFPAGMVVLAGLLFAAVQADRLLLFYFVLTLAQIALLNFKAYESRYFLFLIPLFGAAAGYCSGHIWVAANRPWAKLFTVLAMAAIVALAVNNALDRSVRALHAQDRELGDILEATEEHLSPKSLVLARKDHLCFYAGCRSIFFPQVNDLEELRVFLEQQSSHEALYVFYGAAERRFRSGLARLSIPDAAPIWLQPVAVSPGPPPAVLYRYIPAASPGK